MNRESRDGAGHSDAPLLVTGPSGVGKSTLCGALRDLGVPTFDFEDAGLARWIDADGTRMPDPGPGDRTGLRWVVDRRLLATHIAERRPVVVTGAAANLVNCLVSFRGAIYLDASPPVLQDRLRTRTKAHAYGSVASERQQVLELAPAVRRQFERRGALVVDADGRVEDVARAVLDQLLGRGASGRQ